MLLVLHFGDILPSAEFSVLAKFEFEIKLTSFTISFLGSREVAAELKELI